MPLQEIRLLNLSHNEIADLTVLVEMCRADAEDRRRFAPYLRLYISENPVMEKAQSDDAVKQQLERLKGFGVRVNPQPESPAPQQQEPAGS
jgi:internalin A